MSKHYATCVAVCDGTDRYANAKLISLAPKMLAAIEGAMNIVDLWQPSEDTPEEHWEEAKAVYLMKSSFEDILREIAK